MRKLTVLKANHRGVVVVIRTRLPWETKSTNGCCFWMNLDTVYLSILWGFFSKWCSYQIKLVGEFLGLSQLKIWPSFVRNRFFFPLFLGLTWMPTQKPPNWVVQWSDGECFWNGGCFWRKKGQKRCLGQIAYKSPFICWFFARNGRNGLDSLRFCKVPQIGDTHAPTVWNGWMATAMIWPMKLYHMILDTPASCFSPFHHLQPHSFCEGSPEGQATLLRCLSKIHVDDTWRTKGGDGGNMGGWKHGKTWGKILRRENGSSK